MPIFIFITKASHRCLFSGAWNGSRSARRRYCSFRLLKLPKHTRFLTLFVVASFSQFRRIKPSCQPPIRKRVVRALPSTAQSRLLDHSSRTCSDNTESTTQFGAHPIVMMRHIMVFAYFCIICLAPVRAKNFAPAFLFEKNIYLIPIFIQPEFSRWAKNAAINPPQRRSCCWNWGSKISCNSNHTARRRAGCEWPRGALEAGFEGVSYPTQNHVSVLAKC